MKRLVLASVFLAASGGFVMAAPRCGWLENPTPGNWWLTDKDGTWVLATQGGTETPGMDKVPDISVHDYVMTNGNYGYACACLEAKFDKDKTATEILSVRQLSLAKCRNDHALPKP